MIGTIRLLLSFDSTEFHLAYPRREDGVVDRAYLPREVGLCQSGRSCPTRALVDAGGSLRTGEFMFVLLGLSRAWYSSSLSASAKSNVLVSGSILKDCA